MLSTRRAARINTHAPYAKMANRALYYVISGCGLFISGRGRTVPDCPPEKLATMHAPSKIFVSSILKPSKCVVILFTCFLFIFIHDLGVGASQTSCSFERIFQCLYVVQVRMRGFVTHFFLSEMISNFYTFSLTHAASR